MQRYLQETRIIAHSSKFEILVETRDDQGRLHGIQINRLKDKLGTRKVPTAELLLDGTPAQPDCRCRSRRGVSAR